MPSRTDSSLSAFDKLDSENRGYVTRSDVNQLPGHINFDSADRDRDGRLTIDEFQRFWQDYEGPSAVVRFRLRGGSSGPNASLDPPAAATLA